MTFPRAARLMLALSLAGIAGLPDRRRAPELIARSRLGLR